MPRAPLGPEGPSLHLRRGRHAEVRRIADALHRYGGTVGAADLPLRHHGQLNTRDNMTPLWSLSRFRRLARRLKPHDDPRTRIEESHPGFPDAARAAVRSNFDSMGCTRTHSYLLIQSLSPYGQPPRRQSGKTLHPDHGGCTGTHAHSHRSGAYPRAPELSARRLFLPVGSFSSIGHEQLLRDRRPSRGPRTFRLPGTIRRLSRRGLGSHCRRILASTVWARP